MRIDSKRFWDGDRAISTELEDLLDRALTSSGEEVLRKVFILHLAVQVLPDLNEFQLKTEE